jgi:hypothetical protein
MGRRMDGDTGRDLPVERQRQPLNFYRRIIGDGSSLDDPLLPVKEAVVLFFSTNLRMA